MPLGEELADWGLIPPQLAHDADVVEDMLPSAVQDVIEEAVDDINSARGTIRPITQYSQDEDPEPPKKRRKKRNKMVYRNRGSSKKTISHKVSALQRKVALIQPEIKSKDIAITGASVADAAVISTALMAGIAEGTGNDERTGETIKVMSIEVRGNVWGSRAVNGVDFYVLKFKDPGNSPIYANFIPVIGGHYKTDLAYEMYHEMAQRSVNQYNFLNYKKRFHNGLRVEYDAAGAVKRGEIQLAVKNDSGGASTGIEYSIRVWYYDA